MKRQPTEWEKMVANCISGKVLHPKYIKNSYNSIEKKSKQSDFKIEYLNRHFSKKDTNGQ